MRVNAFKIQYYSKRTLCRFIKRLPSLKRIYLNAFPAVHIKPLDWYDYALRFSSELLILILAFAVAGLNFFHFYISDESADHSFAAKFLSYHPDLNRQLYEKNNIITTKVISAYGLAPLAQAEDFGALAADPQNEPAFDEAQNFENDVLVQPNPDTLRSLIAKQIKVYQTASGDTLSLIAKQNGISVQTLMWANKLNSETIKPGWYLVIPPVDSVLHEASANDTLPDIAKKYSGNLETIISFNGLENAEDIEAGQLVIVPGGKMPQAPKPKTPAPSGGKVKPGSKIEQVEKGFAADGSEHLFPKGYCTWYVAQKVRVRWGGNAKNWLANAKAAGAVIGNQPAVGTIVVTTDNRRYGHVAYIENVNEGGFTVSEMNYEKFGRVNTRWIDKDSKIIRGYIYP